MRPPAVERDHARQLRVAGHRPQPLVGAALETVAEETRDRRRRGARSTTSLAPVQGRNSVVAMTASAGADDGGGPDRAQHLLTPQMDQIACGDDDGQARHHQRDAGAADDAVEIEQARDQASRQRRRDGEEINEMAGERIDRRPIDDRRLFRLAGEPARVEQRQQQDAGQRQQQAADQPSPVQRPAAEDGDVGPCRPRQRVGADQPDQHRAAPARRSPGAQTRGRTTSARAVRAWWRAQIPRSAATGRSRRRWSAAEARLRSTRRTMRCAGSGRSIARNAAAAAPIADAPAPAGRTRRRAS